MAEYIFDIPEAFYDEQTGEAVMKLGFKGKLVRCKDCKHRPAFRDDEDGNRYVEGPRYQETLKNGLTVTLEDTGCPCVNGLDSYFSYIPKDDWFCANGERRAEE